MQRIRDLVLEAEGYLARRAQALAALEDQVPLAKYDEARADWNEEALDALTGLVSALRAELAKDDDERRYGPVRDQGQGLPTPLRQ